MLKTARATTHAHLNAIREDTEARNGVEDEGGRNVAIQAVEFSANLATMNDAGIKRMERALRKINEGTYGECDECKKPISPNRLKATIWAAYCINCQEAFDQEKRSVSAFAGK